MDSWNQFFEICFCLLIIWLDEKIYCQIVCLQGILMLKKVATFATPENWFMKKWKWLSICSLNCSKMVETLFFLICNVMLSVKASVWQAMDNISQHCVLSEKVEYEYFSKRWVCTIQSAPIKMCQLTSNHSIDLFAVFSTFYVASERENPLTPLERAS